MTLKIQKRKENLNRLFVDDRYKAQDLRISTWNVGSLHTSDATIQLADVLENYKANITAIQKMAARKGKIAIIQLPS